jgi:hypothetical protein
MQTTGEFFKHFWACSCGVEWIGEGNECECGKLVPIPKVLTNKAAQDLLAGQIIEKIELSTAYNWDGAFTKMHFKSGYIAIMSGHCDYSIVDGFITPDDYYISVMDE